MVFTESDIVRKRIAIWLKSCVNAIESSDWWSDGNNFPTSDEPLIVDQSLHLGWKIEIKVANMGYLCGVHCNYTGAVAWEINDAVDK